MIALKNNRENYPLKCFSIKEKETRVEFSLGLGLIGLPVTGHVQEVVVLQVPIKAWSRVYDVVALKSYYCGMPIYSLTRDSVSRYSRPLRCCIRNKMSRSANAKYHYILPFFHKIYKGNLPWMYSCVFWCEFIDLVDLGLLV